MSFRSIKPQQVRSSGVVLSHINTHSHMQKSVIHSTIKMHNTLERDSAHRDTTCVGLSLGMSSGLETIVPFYCIARALL
jgi:hypothetical protein